MSLKILYIKKNGLFIVKHLLAVQNMFYNTSVGILIELQYQMIEKLKFKRCLEIFRVKPREDEKLSSAELFFKLTGIKIGMCKICEKGNLIEKGILMPRSYSPP